MLVCDICRKELTFKNRVDIEYNNYLSLSRLSFVCCRECSEEILNFIKQKKSSGTLAEQRCENSNQENYKTKI